MDNDNTERRQGGEDALVSRRRTKSPEEEKTLPARIRRGRKMLVSVVVFAFVLLACVLLKLDLIKPDFLPYVALIIAYAILLGIWIAPENRELLEWRKKRLDSKAPRSENEKKQEHVP